MNLPPAHAGGPLVLTHGYFLADDPVEQRIMRPYPPLGLLSISAWLDRRGLNHDVIDTTFRTVDDVVAELARLRPQMIAFYVTLMTRRTILGLVRRLRADPKHAGLTVVLGGPDARYNAGDYLDHGIDILVVGEGEETMAALAELDPAACRDPAVLAGIAGLVHRGADGRPATTPARAHLPRLDDLPRPARHRIDLAPYFNAWRQAHGETSLNVSTQRGCPYTCNWCSRAVYGKSYRRRSAELVVAELADLSARYAPDMYWFVDDVFTVNHRWLTDFATALDTAGLSIRYECITRADRMTDEVVALLARTGCKRVWIGAESGSQRILDAMDRRVTVEQVTAMIRAAAAAGIETGTFLMLGYPGETEADILATRRYLQAARPDRFTVTLAYPIRGTEFHDAVADHVTGPAFDDGSDRDNRFPRSYGDRYYAQALRYLNHAAAVDQAGAIWHPRALRHHLAAGLARAGMWWHRRFGPPDPGAPEGTAGHG